MVNLLSSSLPAIIDIVVVLLILLFAILGFAKGFVNTFLKSFGTIISLLLSVLLCATVVNFLSEQYSLGVGLSNKLLGTVNSIFGEELMSLPIEATGGEALKEGGISGWIITNLLQIKENGAYPQGATIGQAISQVFAYYIWYAIIFIFLFIIFKVLCFLLIKFVVKLQEKKIIGTTDRVFGLFLGLIKGILYIQGTLFALQSIPLGFIQSFNLAVDSSVITNFISNINIYGVIVDAMKNIVIR